jgi:type II secretory pathway pseudopilin PulG
VTTPSTTASRLAYTLIEVMIAMLLFSTALVMIIQAMQAASSYQALGNAQDDLQADSRALMRQISNDLIGSSWYFPDAKNPRVKYAGVTSTLDRSLRYYPYVQIQNAAGRGQQFPQHARNDSAIGSSLPSEYRTLLDPPPPVPGQMSFYGPSQELIFLRSTLSLWNSQTDSFNQNQDQPPILKFTSAPRKTWQTANQHSTLDILHPSGWMQTTTDGNVTGYVPRPIDPKAESRTSDRGPTAQTEPYGVVLESGMLLDPTNDLQSIGANWMSISGEGFQPPRQRLNPDGSSTGFADVSDLKEFGYCVVPSQIGFGRLVRTVRVNNARSHPLMDPAAQVWAEVGTRLASDASTPEDGMVVDKVLSDHVVRIVFDTFRTVDAPGASGAVVTTLDINQIKIKVFMARRSTANNDVIVKQIFETVVSMRAQNSAHDKSSSDAGSNGNLLGTSPVGLP